LSRVSLETGAGTRGDAPSTIKAESRNQRLC